MNEDIEEPINPYTDAPMYHDSDGSQPRAVGGEDRLTKPCTLDDTNATTNHNDDENLKNMEQLQEGETMLDDVSMNQDIGYLANLPNNLLTHLGLFLSVHDRTAMSLTNTRLYRERSDYSCLCKSDLFHLVLEERLPQEQDHKTTLQPFRFLFQSGRYGTLQVDLSLVDPPAMGQRGSPRLRRSMATIRGNKKKSWAAMRINIQKKFPKNKDEACCNNRPNNNDKVIFRLDQSLPGCSFHFESKLIVGWGAGHLGYLVQICLVRMDKLREEGAENDSPHPWVPSTQDIMMKFQTTIKENVLRHVKKEDAKAMLRQTEKGLVDVP